MAEIKNDGAQKRTVTHQVKKDVWEKAQDKALKKIGKNLKVDGFRAGKVPEHVMKKHISPEDIHREAINTVLNEEFKKVLDETKLVPFIQPSVDVTRLSETELELTFTIYVEPEIKMPQYKDRKIKKEDVKVSEKDVDDEIKTMLGKNAELVLKDGEAVSGDIVIIDFEGFTDGVAFEGGSAKNHELELGSNSFIPGFEEQLIGHKAGEEFEIKVHFPKEYHPPLADKDAIFKIKIHEVKTKKLPELTDDFAKSLNMSDVADINSLHQHVKRDLLAKKEKEANKNVMTKLISDLVDEVDTEIEHEIIHEEMHGLQERMMEDLKQQGLSMEDYLKHRKITEEEFNKEMHEEAEKSLKRMLVIRNIIKVEGIEVSDADLEFELSKMADQYKMELSQIKQILEPQIAEFKNQILFTRLEQFLLDANLV